jgi:hypothetical protein
LDGKIAAPFWAGRPKEGINRRRLAHRVGNRGAARPITRPFHSLRDCAQLPSLAPQGKGFSIIAD